MGNLTEISSITIKGVERKRAVRTLSDYHNFKQSKIVNGDLIEENSSIEAQYEVLVYQERIVDGVLEKDFENKSFKTYVCRDDAKIVVIPNPESPIGVDLFFCENQEQYDIKVPIEEKPPLFIFPSEKDFVEELKENSRIVIAKGIEGMEQVIPIPLTQAQIKAIFIHNLDDRGEFN
jgi:hypothetical protein